MKLSTLRKKADRLLQIHCVAENPQCLLCFFSTSECHHFFQKSLSNALRYDKENLIPLCRKHHLLHHLSGDPLIVKNILEIKDKKWFEKLQKKRNTIQKVNKQWYLEIIERLEDQ